MTEFIGYLYEMLPGFSLSLVAVIVASLLTENPHESVNKDFSDMEKILDAMK